MEKSDIIRFRNGARKVIIEHFVQEAKSNYSLRSILWSLFYGAISLAVAIFLIVLLIVQNVNSEISFLGNVLLVIFIVIFSFAGISSIKNNLLFKKIRYYVKDLHNEQKKKGLFQGLKFFLSQNLTFKDSLFFQEWLEIFRKHEEKRDILNT